MLLKLIKLPFRWLVGFPALWITAFLVRNNSLGYCAGIQRIMDRRGEWYLKEVKRTLLTRSCDALYHKHLCKSMIGMQGERTGGAFIGMIMALEEHYPELVAKRPAGLASGWGEEVLRAVAASELQPFVNDYWIGRWYIAGKDEYVTKVVAVATREEKATTPHEAATQQSALWAAVAIAGQNKSFAAALQRLGVSIEGLSERLQQMCEAETLFAIQSITGQGVESIDAAPGNAPSLGSLASDGLRNSNPSVN